MCAFPLRSLDISIHAPRGGSDPRHQAMGLCCGISIHAPRGGSDKQTGKILVGLVRFQSTLPVGGATGCSMCGFGIQLISIHAPRGGSDPSHTIASYSEYDFNPRSPWGERLAKALNADPYELLFQSTLPVGGATSASTGLFPALAISIHAPRGGSDDLYI